jgi:hypothetical protein
MTSAAARSAALLRQLDESRRRDDMRHAPNCERPGVAHERGHSVTVTRCLSCGAITAERNIHPNPKP